MRTIIVVLLALVAAESTQLVWDNTQAEAKIKYVKTSYGGYYRDTSNDGDPYNNANYLGYNPKR